MGWKEILKNKEPGEKVDSDCHPQNTYNPQSYFDLQFRLALDELNSRGASLMDFPEPTRQRAFEFEQKMTNAANAGKRELFMGYLVQWRRCLS